MAVQPLSHPRVQGHRSPDRLAGAGPVRRKAPSARGIARRRVLVISTKWLLPVLAIALLSLVAVWPELARVTDESRISFRRIFGAIPDSAVLVEPHYRGVDSRGRPYTLTADTATQVSAERVNLDAPIGDVTLEGGHWMMVQSRDGVFLQHRDLLDLSHDVQLYRDDGVTMRTQSAAVDLKQGAAASSDRTHAEGPFGQLDSQGFTVLDKGSTIQFQGPAHLILNQAHS
ncbi:MAG: LPS export ABC transporter periplasmic protein LptC [Acetobacteraceae bacterium]|nr:LPS export ABC transporter periplasmic protein LptC [Acetobacteraceae bacterium]